mmetsp:Transcript_5140/g.17324  ORF Transcript_5140/g.17324 Transcript_5140/m.17324 type:complete len:218 (-) Transcript_5140:78-731(-)
MSLHQSLHARRKFTNLRGDVNIKRLARRLELAVVVQADTHRPRGGGNDRALLIRRRFFLYYRPVHVLARVFCQQRQVRAIRHTHHRRLPTLLVDNHQPNHVTITFTLRQRHHERMHALPRIRRLQFVPARLKHAQRRGKLRGRLCLRRIAHIRRVRLPTRQLRRRRRRRARPRALNASSRTAHARAAHHRRRRARRRRRPRRRHRRRHRARHARVTR